jgi:hypothetical protein
MYYSGGGGGVLLRSPDRKQKEWKSPADSLLGSCSHRSVRRCCSAAEVQKIGLHTAELASGRLAGLRRPSLAFSASAFAVVAEQLPRIQRSPHFLSTCVDGKHQSLVTNPQRRICTNRRMCEEFRSKKTDTHKDISRSHVRPNGGLLLVQWHSKQETAGC